MRGPAVAQGNIQRTYYRDIDINIDIDIDIDITRESKTNCKEIKCYKLDYNK